MAIRFLLRVDDFPAWNEAVDRFVPSKEFEDFHRILVHSRIPYLLAVTPQPALRPTRFRNRVTRALSEEECRLLRTVSQEGVCLALHGVTHQTRDERQHSEFFGLGDLEFCERIQYGLAELKYRTGIRADVFVPPFNRISQRQLELLSSRFRVVCGGPESVPYLGNRVMEKLSSASVYVPSYYPFYGRAHEIWPSLEDPRGKGIVCLTLHWEWERRRRYSELAVFCEAIGSRVIAWEELTRGSSS